MSLEAIEAELQRRQQNPQIQSIDAELQKRSDPQAVPDDQGISESQFKKPALEWKQEIPQDTGAMIWDRIGANVQAGYTGVMELGSSLVKIADKIGLAPQGSAKSAQDAFNEAEKIYQGGPYPETAVTKFAGSMLPTAPLSAPLGLLSKLGTTGKYLGAATGGSAIGAVTGGLMNEPGNSPDDIWNESAAKTGAALGAPLGAAGQFLSGYGKNVGAYQTGKEALKDFGYKGPVLARDFADDVVANTKSVWMDNIITTGIRNEQLHAITPAIKTVLGSILDRTEKQQSHNVGRVIRAVNNKLETESSNKWDDLFTAAKDAGIGKINTDLTKQSTSDFLDQYGQSLSKNDRNLLSILAQSKQVDFRVLNKVKGSDIWKMSEKFGNKDGSVFEDMSDGLKNIYWNITDDIGNTLKQNPDLQKSWQEAKSFTQGVKEIFNVRNNRQLVNAIDDVNEKTGQLKTFINSVTKPVSAESSKYFNKALGETYQKTVSDLTFKKVFDSSMGTEAEGLNIGKFYKGIKEANDAKLLNNDTVKALGGIEQYFNKIQSAQKAASESSTATHLSYTMPYAKTAAVGTGYMTGGVPGALGSAAAVFAGPALLGAISRSSPLKNTLIGLSRVWGKNPGTTEYLMDKIGKQLSSAGVIISENPEGISADIKRSKK
jgi:hypothetical protein